MRRGPRALAGWRVTTAKDQQSSNDFFIGDGDTEYVGPPLSGEGYQKVVIDRGRLVGFASAMESEISTAIADAMSCPSEVPRIARPGLTLFVLGVGCQD
jgi:hypothetical protein